MPAKRFEEDIQQLFVEKVFNALRKLFLLPLFNTFNNSGFMCYGQKRSFVSSNAFYMQEDVDYSIHGVSGTSDFEEVRLED